MAQRGFDHRRERVGAALREPVLAGGRFRGNVFACGFGINSALRLHGGFECLEDDRACLGRLPEADDEAAILVVDKVKFAHGLSGQGP